MGKISRIFFLYLLIIVCLFSCGKETYITSSLQTMPNYNPNATITSTPIATASANVQYTYQFSIFKKTKDISFSASDLPSWLSFDPSSGLLQGTPTNDNLGKNDVKIDVIQNQEILTFQSFSIDVKPYTTAYYSIQNLTSTFAVNDNETIYIPKKNSEVPESSQTVSLKIHCPTCTQEIKLVYSNGGSNQQIHINGTVLLDNQELLISKENTLSIIGIKSGTAQLKIYANKDDSLFKTLNVTVSQKMYPLENIYYGQGPAIYWTVNDNIRLVLANQGDTHTSSQLSKSEVTQTFSVLSSIIQQLASTYKLNYLASYNQLVHFYINNNSSPSMGSNINGGGYAIFMPIEEYTNINQASSKATVAHEFTYFLQSISPFNANQNGMHESHAAWIDASLFKSDGWTRPWKPAYVNSNKQLGSQDYSDSLFFIYLESKEGNPMILFHQDNSLTSSDKLPGVVSTYVSGKDFIDIFMSYKAHLTAIDFGDFSQNVFTEISKETTGTSEAISQDLVQLSCVENICTPPIANKPERYGSNQINVNSWLSSGKQSIQFTSLSGGSDAVYTLGIVQINPSIQKSVSTSKIISFDRLNTSPIQAATCFNINHLSQTNDNRLIVAVTSPDPNIISTQTYNYQIELFDNQDCSN